nr:hypothetical protein [Tanacetum cinerariifolium]
MILFLWILKKEEKKSVEPKSKGKRIKRVANSALKQKSSKKQKMMQEQESTKSDEEESADYEHEKRVENVVKNKEIKGDEEPPRVIMWLKGRVNKDGEFPNDEIRSVGDKLKEADDRIKEGTLNLDDGTDAMTVVFGKEKGGYARGVGSEVTYKMYFYLPRSRQATNERIDLLRT